MELQQLRYLVALSQEMSFYKAAQKVGVTQPTLSQQIKKLEDELGEPLFERSPHHVRLTDAGKTFLGYAISAVDQLNLGKEELQKDKLQLKGVVKIAFIPTIGPYLIPKLLPRLRTKMPQVELKVYEETTSRLIENLKSGHFDLGVLALPVKDAALVEKVLAEESFYFAVHKKSPLARQKKVTLKEVKNEDLLLLQEGHCFRDQALEFCTRYQSSLNILFEGSSLASVMNLAASGYGSTFVPKLAKDKKYSSDLVFLEIAPTPPKRQIGAVWRMSMGLSHVQKAVLEIIESVLLC